MLVVRTQYDGEESNRLNIINQSINPFQRSQALQDLHDRGVLVDHTPEKLAL